MPYCTNCGTEALADARFCQSCGAAQATPALTRVGRYRISPRRIVVMSILSGSLYFLYWLYITWKQYRDHTGEQVYPVWHALTQFVPIYSLFRVHAHARSFKELMTRANVDTTISTGVAVFAVLVYGVVNYAGFRLTFDEITEGVAVALFLIDVFSVIIVAGLLLRLQENLNRYWSSIIEGEVQDAGISVGEVVFAVIGILLWAGTLATLLSPSYRAS